MTFHQTSPLMEINVNHITESLLRNAFIAEVGKDLHQDVAPALTSSTPPTPDDFKHMLVVNVIRNNIHIVEQLLDGADSTGGMLPLPPGVREALCTLHPLYSFSSLDVTAESLDHFLSDLSDMLEKSLKWLGGEDLFTKALQWLRGKVTFAAWCLNQSFSGSVWPPKAVLELCTQQPSSLSSLKVLGGLQLVNPSSVETFLGNQTSSMNVYRGFVAVNSFTHYLYRHFQQLKSATYNLDEVENLIASINSKEISLQVLEDSFSICFLRKEDILFEDTASDSATEDASRTTKEGLKAKKSGDPSCPSNSNSPSNTQTGTSSGALAGNKGNISLGFLCQHPDRLQIALTMLKRRLEALEVVGDDGELSLRHRKLEQRVSQALWRLQLVEHDRTSSYFSRPQNGNHDGCCCTVRKAWLARLNPSVQTWYGYSPGRRKLRSPPSSSSQKKKKKQKKQGECVVVDPLLMDRLLAEPLSLMVMSMMKSHLSAARQVADLYQLWETPEGRELHFSLAHAAAAQELQRTGRQVVRNPDGDRKDAIDALSLVRLPSAVETQLSTLQQAAMPSLTADDDWQSAVLVADLVNSSTLSPPEVQVQLLNFALRRIEGTVDLNVEPWRTLRRFTECSNYHLERSSDRYAAIQSHLPLDRQLLQAQADRLDSIRTLFRQLVEALDGPPEAVDSALDNLNQSIAMADRTTTPLFRTRRYLQLLRQLAPSDLRDLGANSLLVEHDVGELIMQHLRENAEAVPEVERIARSLGIELASFLAGSLCKLVDVSSEQELVGKLIAYLRSRCPLLAQVVELQLQTEHGFLSAESPASDESMDIFLRYLKRAPSTKEHQELLLQNRPQKCRRVRSLPDSPSPIADPQNSLLAESEEEPTARLGALILEAIPQAAAQLEHLSSQPLLIIEQLLMNSQIGLATDLVKLVRLNGSDQDVEEINNILLRYATKALALGLPDIPAPRASDSAQQVADRKKNKKKNAAFVVPATVPPKEQWVADADVSQCPCCQTVQFSMFDRRHHCRRCGRVVCSHCSPHRKIVEGYGDVPVRTCVDCFSTLRDRPDVPETRTSVRPLDQSGGQTIVWRLSLDTEHNQIARREFSYEHAPNLALALAMVHLCSCNETMANFLLDQSSSMLATLHRHLLHGTLMDVCSDPLMMFSLIKSLILSAKMRYSDIVAAPSKSKPSRGLARCDALLGQIDLLSLLASASCLHLLPAQPLSQLDTWRKLRDRLIDVELWSLALDVSTKAGLDAGSVWAAWGLVCLKAGNFQGARQRFQRVLKSTKDKSAKTSPLLQEIVTVLEGLSIPCAGNIGDSSSMTSSWTSSKRSRRLSSPSSQPSPVFNCDNPQLIVASLSRLSDICSGQFAEVEDKNCILEEILFYLDSYGQPESPYGYLVERSGRIDLAVQRYASSSRYQTPDVFNQGLLLPCLKASKLEDLVIEMKRHDSSFHSWKSHLLAAAQLLETRCSWNCLYQLHCLSGDWIRASLVAIRRLFLNDLFSIETLIARTDLLDDIASHLNHFLSRQTSTIQGDVGGDSDKQLPLCWPPSEVSSLLKTVQLQKKVTSFLDACLKEGKISSELLAVVKSVTQSGESNNSSGGGGVFLIPTLLGSRQFRCSSAVLVTCANPDTRAFELSWQICTDLRVRLDRYFRLSAFVLIRRSQVTPLIHLVEYIKARMTSQSVVVGFFEMDELLVECATLVQERDKESRTPDLELVVQEIKKPACKIRAFINLGWLKAAYLLAVKSGQVADVIHIQQEATRLQQTAVLTLCDKWLRVRNVAK